MLEGFLLILIVCVVFVNGWTDAPNAIACAVSTGAIRYRSAAWMAGVCNLLGLLAVSLTGAPVADTMASLANFSGGRQESLSALCAAMASIVIFAVAAWRFGIPTSESHALIAALTGASLALGGSGGPDVSAWAKVLTGLFASVACGYLLSRLISRLLSDGLARYSEKKLGRIQILAAAGMALMHGAQDGQKFVAVFVMADMLAKGGYLAGPIVLGEHLPVLFLCALTMALGTSMGGGRIVELVGGKMVRLRRSEGVCADLGGAVCLLAASVWGIPMSTTHTKTTAMMGAASSGKLDGKAARDIVLTWIITFPVCGALGYAITKAVTVVW